LRQSFFASRRRWLASCLGLGTAGALGQTNLVDAQGQAVRVIEVPFVVTPDPVVRTMLDLAEVGPRDTVYDLGCGDGRIVVAAARERGARGVGIEIDPDLVARARAAAGQAGVAHLVSIEQGDLFERDMSQASVVMLYLSDDLNTRLWPKLRRELKTGSRVVSHRFIIRDVPPRRSVEARGANLHLWIIP
jgi:cyclopropane fatty-acyl-phospholipid synthase-like methyltransferase